ncbi:unnamed protein product [Rhodiola kirilowii]
MLNSIGPTEFGPNIKLDPIRLAAIATSSSSSTFGSDRSSSICKTVIAMTPSAIRIRRLEIHDKRKGFMELLQQLSICDAVSDKDFEDRFQELSRCGDDHVICVIEDLESGKIVGTGSVFIEKKFLRNCGKVGHIEDVMVDGNARGMQLGMRVVEFLTEHARSVGCYKVILDCSDENVLFYDKCGFRRKEIQMAKYF